MAPGGRTIYRMSKRAAYVVVSATSAVLVAILLAVAVGTSRDRSSSQLPTPLETVSTPPATLVVRLEPSVAMLTHEGSSGSTSFDKGALEIRISADSDSLRLIAAAAPAAGGRVDPSSLDYTRFPLNLPVVVSYGPTAARVSIFGRLAATPVLVDGTVSYKITVFDAPGEDATYTVSGSFDIPETLEAPVLTLAGQLLTR